MSEPTTLDLRKLHDLIYHGFAETDRRMHETDRLMQETARRMQETDRQMQETDRRMQETDRQMQETGRQIKELGKQIGGLGNALGDFAEHSVSPAVIRLFGDLGISLKEVMRKVRKTNHDHEYDIVAINTEVTVVVSVKFTLKREDIDHFLNKELPAFRELHERLAAPKIIGAVAGLTVEESQKDYAAKKGLYVLGQSGDSIVFMNDPSFKPVYW